MGIGDWDDRTDFGWRRIRDNVCLLRPTTIEKISHLIVAEGHRLDPDAAKKTRADSFVAETNIHYPSESSLMLDGVRLIMQACVQLSALFGLEGWRQHEHLLTRIKHSARNIQRISSRKGPHYHKRLKRQYRTLLGRTRKILRRARCLCDELQGQPLSNSVALQISRLKTLIERTDQVCDTAHRRVIKGETVANEDKVFSLFEPHTQLYKRGKAGEPVQFGRLVLIYEDAAGFITHHHVLPRDAQDRDVIVEQTRIVQERLHGRIEEASFDCGFHSPQNQLDLAEIIKHPCLPKPGAKQSAEQRSAASVKFRSARRRHAGVESAIGALQAGNGMKRCRDRSELGFERYAALAVLGRNLHTLGKLLLACEQPKSEAAATKRKRVAA
jgi:transposase, IS5 family